MKCDYYQEEIPSGESTKITLQYVGPTDVDPQLVGGVFNWRPGDSTEVDFIVHKGCVYLQLEMAAENQWVQK